MFNGEQCWRTDIFWQKTLPRSYRYSYFAVTGICGSSYPVSPVLMVFSLQISVWLSEQCRLCGEVYSAPEFCKEITTMNRLRTANKAVLADKMWLYRDNESSFLPPESPTQLTTYRARIIRKNGICAAASGPE